MASSSVTSKRSAPQAMPQQSRAGRLQRRLTNERTFPWLLVLPALILLVAVAIGPTLFVIIVSFCKYTPGQGLEFIGLHNFERAFTTPRFWHGLYVTAWFVFLSVGIQLVIGFGAALSLQRINPRLRQIATAILLVPMMIAPTVVGVLWKMLFKARYGAIDYLFQQAFHMPGPDWMANQWWALVGLIIADVWEWTPFVTILLLAGLQSLPREIYEAAYVDGSKAWQVFKNMTLPLMRPFIFLAVFLRMIDAFKTFDLIFGVTRGGPGDFTESISWYTYKIGFTYFEQGYAAALSFVQLLLIIILGKALLTQLTRVKTESKAA